MAQPLMKPAPFTYHDPTSVDELIALLGAIEDAKLLAGGQSLMPMLNLRLAQPDHVIDLNTVTGLSGIETTETHARVGAMTRQSTLMKSVTLTQAIPVLGEALHWVGHFQTRTRGTIGGSLTHLDPAAELPAVALLYDAELTVNGPDGSRVVPIREWPIAYMIPNLAEDEVLTSIDFALWGESHGHAFVEVARRFGDFAIVAVGALLAISNGVITRAAVALAGTQPTPHRLDDIEAALVGQTAGPDTFRAAGELAKSREAMSDSYTSSRYRQRLAGVLVERALTTAASRANSGGL